MQSFYYRLLLVAFLLFSGTAATCNFNVTGVGSGTGVPGLNTADEIIRHPDVQSVIGNLEEEIGGQVTLFDDSRISPPNIEGNYQLTGEQLYPSEDTLVPGSVRWSKQSADNHISTDYSQFLGSSSQSGTSRVGEIIRGDGNSFTVYSIVEITQDTCSARGLFVISARKLSSGTVRGVYCSIILDDNGGCITTDTAGTIEFIPR